MNILIFASDNDRASGAFLSMTKLAACLKNDFGHTVYVVLSRMGNGQEILQELQIPFYTIRSYNWIMRQSEKDNVIKRTELLAKILLNNIAIMKCCKLIKEKQIDIVHINTTWSYIGSEAAKKCSVPYIWHIREFLEEDQKVCFFDKKYAYSLLNDAAKIICISKSIYNKYSSILSPSKMEIVYNGVDNTKLQGRKEPPFQNSELTFLIVGTISESKGQIELVKACGLIKEKLGNFKLLILGKGQEEYISYVQNYVKKSGLQNNIVFCGFKSNTDDYYKQADITFVCSKAEAFGRVTVEAMMAGSLVIGADSAATKELITDRENGLLYKSGDSEDLARVIEWALAHKSDAIAMARCGHDYMTSNMTAYNNARKINEIYAKTISDSRD